MINSLNNKWKEFLFGFSGFGPNFLMVLMGAYFTDAVNPAALPENSLQAIGTACYILPILFPILFALAKAFDGIIDVPLAHLTDTLSTKWGRRRPAIAVCLIPMTVAYAMCWLPIGGADGQLLNTIWIFVWALVFFATYTMSLIAYYGSYSTTCINEAQRVRVSSYKSFFDTISYCVVYALVPLLLQAFNLHVDDFAFLCLPMMATMVIPLFLIKEGAKYGYPENEGMQEEKITFKESLRLTFGNKTFLRWLLVNCCTFFGLQMFLVAMNAMILGGMNFNGAEMALVNTCAFAPVPVMLYLFTKVKAKKGIRFTYQTCLIAFAVAILSFFFASTFVLGENNKILQYIIACAGGVLGSWAIGSFFMMPYLITAQISSVEEKLTKKNHSAMYFAANALVTSIIGAISSSLVYENIKMLFISKDASGIVWAENEAAAATLFGVAGESVFNLGTLIVPFIVAIVCIIGAVLAFKMPRDYTPKQVAAELKQQNPDLDISAVEAEEEAFHTQEKEEIIFVQVGLTILSGFIFGFIWVAFLLNSLKELLGKNKRLLSWLLCCFVPFFSIFYLLKRHEELRALGQEKGVRVRNYKLAYILLGLTFPLLPLNIIALALMQVNVNRFYETEAAQKAQIGEKAEA